MSGSLPANIGDGQRQRHLRQQQGDGYSRSMQYDGLDRLTAAGSASFGGDHWHRYTYDVLDNLRSAKLGGVREDNYFYDNRNQLVNIRTDAGATTIGLGYDVQGNLNNKNGQAYTFDYGNRLRDGPRSAGPKLAHGASLEVAAAAARTSGTRA